MSIFSWIFGNKNKPDEELSVSPEHSSLLAFETELGDLLNADRFIARSDYRQIVADFADFYRQIKALQDSDVLTEFSNKRHIAEDRLSSFLSLYEELSDEKVGSGQHTTIPLSSHIWFPNNNTLITSSKRLTLPLNSMTSNGGWCFPMRIIHW